MNIDIPSVLISSIAAIFSAASWMEAKKSAGAAKMANHYSRLNSLFELQKGYRERMLNFGKLANEMSGFEGGVKAEEMYSQYDLWLREVNIEIEKYHAFIIKDSISINK